MTKREKRERERERERGAYSVIACFKIEIFSI